MEGGGSKGVVEREGTRGGREGGRERGRERAREGREEAMMLDRPRESVEEGPVEGGRVDEGNERRRDWTRHGWWEGLSEEGREQGRETSMEVS